MKAITERERDRRSRFTTVYPGDMAPAMLGHSPTTYNLALGCWTHLLAEATTENERHFTAGEWEVLHDLAGKFKWDPDVADPGEQIASVLRRPAWLSPDPHRRDKLAEKVQELDYVRAWAMLWACFHAERQEKATGVRPESWWLLKS